MLYPWALHRVLQEAPGYGDLDKWLNVYDLDDLLDANHALDAKYDAQRRLRQAQEEKARAR